MTDLTVPTEGSRVTAPGGAWTPSAGAAGWHHRVLLESPHGSTQLMRVDPGTISEPHAHDRFEQVYILEGSLTDADGTEHPAGSFIVRAPGAIHGGISRDGATLLVVYGDPR